MILYLKIKENLPFCVCLKETEKRKTHAEKSENNEHCNHTSAILFLHVTNIEDLLRFFRNTFYSIEFIPEISLFKCFFKILFFISLISIFYLLLAILFDWGFFWWFFGFFGCMFLWRLLLYDIFLLLYKIIKIIYCIELTFSIKKRGFSLVLD